MAIVVHIGFHKTATTTLQRQFFPALVGCHFEFHGGGQTYTPFRALSDDLMLAPDGQFLEHTMRCYLDEVEQRSPGVVLLSHEGFSGLVFQGAFNRHRNALRLHAVAPGAKVLMVVRHQGAMLRSLYSQYLHHGGCGTFPEFVQDRTPDADEFDVDHLRYDTLLDDYLHLFGPDRVKVMAHEALVRDQRAFLAEMCAFIGAYPDPDANLVTLSTLGRSFSPVSRWVLRHNNRLFRRNRIHPKPRLFALRSAGYTGEFLKNRADPKFFANVSRDMRRSNEELLKQLLVRFEQGNARLAALTGLPLSDFGYPLPVSTGAPVPSEATS